jgi:diaminohydroxyphosphoribosylaminopyrimidine deaminase/5-amino-6-(5-phosphoribosylamino)uracil reductase
MLDAQAEDDRRYMVRSLELARRGEGFVEPNPMVGCVLVREGTVVGEGWHQRFGGPHAEIEALMAAGTEAKSSTAYVTLEPCAHTGKTPPCTQALIKAGVSRVVVASRDPNLHVRGGGIEELQAAGIECNVGILDEEGSNLIAPFRKLMTERRPWVIAKWAMTLDGKLATHTGDSRWISGEDSRARVHQLRGRMDAIIVGRGTVQQDDPLLTVRPPGPRIPTRIVLDSLASLPIGSQLVNSSQEAPVLVAASIAASAERCDELTAAGVEVWQSKASDPEQRWLELLDELGRRNMTNVLVEGGARLLGALFDSHSIDEVHAFIAPKLVGGAGPGAIAGRGIASMSEAVQLSGLCVEQLGSDLYLHGRLLKKL